MNKIDLACSQRRRSDREDSVLDRFPSLLRISVAVEACLLEAVPQAMETAEAETRL